MYSNSSSGAKGTKDTNSSICTTKQRTDTSNYLRNELDIPDTTTYLRNEPGTPDTTTSIEEDGFDVFKEAERAVRSRQKELNTSLQHIHERKRKLFTTEKNIAIQKRTLSYYKKELDNHCCICGGIHIKSSNHVPTNKPNCAAYKMKHQVFLYLSASLKKANLELANMKVNVEDGLLQNKRAKVNMNQSLISFVESSLCLEAPK